VTVTATDAAGNADPTPATLTWTVDTVAPNATILTNPTNPTTSTTATFTFNSSETPTSHQCRIDGAAFATCTSPQTYNSLAAGSHTFDVRALDAAGNTDPTPASYTWTIQAGAAPTVTANTPAGGASGVSILTKPTATFSKAMDAATITSTSFTLTPSGGSPVAATVSYSGSVATLTPNAQLATSTTYTAKLDTTIKASDGTPLASAFTWTFTTTNAPEVKTKSPADGATNVPTGTSTGTPVTATFTRAMDAATFTTVNFTLWRPDNTQVPATPSYNSATLTATITPTLPLTYLSTYTVKLSTAIKAADGVALPSQISWTFTVTGTMISKRINSGATTTYTDTGGNTWLADVNFKNGLTQSFPTRTITGTTDQSLFRDDRYGSSATAPWSYTIPMPNGTYDIKLYFVELTKTAIGQRVFSIDCNATAVNPDISNLDIFKEAGGANKALVKTLVDIPIVNSSVTLKSIVGTDLPEIAAIEFVPKRP
jgi:hypothetical protein